MIFGTHFRWDWLPFFPLLHDYIATVAAELGRYGILLFDHHSVNLIHRYDTRDEMRHVMTHSGPHLPLCPTRRVLLRHPPLSPKTVKPPSKPTRSEGVPISLFPNGKE